MPSAAFNSPARRSGPKARGGRRRWLRVAILGLVSVLVLAAIVQGFRWLEHSAERTEALRKAESGDFESIRTALEGCLQRRPEDAELLRALSTAALKAGRFPEAQAALDQWCQAHPSDPEPYIARMDVAMLQRQLPAAIADAAKVLQLRPEDDEVRRRRALWLFTIGELDEADRESRTCLAHRPADPNVLQLRAEIRHGLGDAAGARDYVEQVLLKEPNRPAALVLRAELYLEAGEPATAIPLLRQVLAQRRERQQAARHYLSLALSQTGQREEAKRVLAEMQQNQAMELWQQYGRTDHKLGLQLRVAESLLETGRANEAVRLLEQLLVQAPECTAAHKLLADHYQQQGQADKSAFHRQRAQP